MVASAKNLWFDSVHRFCFIFSNLVVFVLFFYSNLNSQILSTLLRTWLPFNFEQTYSLQIVYVDMIIIDLRDTLFELFEFRFYFIFRGADFLDFFISFSFFYGIVSIFFVLLLFSNFKIYFCSGNWNSLWNRTFFEVFSFSCSTFCKLFILVESKPMNNFYFSKKSKYFKNLTISANLRFICQIS